VIVCARRLLGRLPTGYSADKIENMPLLADGTDSATVLYLNLLALKSALGIYAHDYDDESTHDSASAVSFGQMGGTVGMKVTICHYINLSYKRMPPLKS
jgi:hypothetical protein